MLRFDSPKHAEWLHDFVGRLEDDFGLFIAEQGFELEEAESIAGDLLNRLYEMSLADDEG